MAEKIWTVEDVFNGHPICLEIYNAVEQYIKSLGDVEISVTKTQVSFGAKRKFAWVWLPIRWTKNRPKNSIVLTFGASHRLVDPRIVESVEPKPGRWTHHVILERAADLNDSVKSWLSQAYEFGKIDRRKRRARPD